MQTNCFLAAILARVVGHATFLIAVTSQAMIHVVDDTERKKILEIILCENAEDDVADRAELLAKDPTIHVLRTPSARPQMAIAAQVQSGRSGYVWPPKVIDENDFAATDTTSQTQQELLRHATALLNEHGVQLVQSLLDPSDVENRAHFVSAGFMHLADLAYIGAEDSEFPSTMPASDLSFAPLHAQQFETQYADLAKIVEDTYVGTQDCPEIGDFRSIADTLESYRGVGQFDAANWFLVQSDGKNVGCLILADQLELPVPALELVYMGIVPSARGRGFGVDVVRFAMARAKELGATRLVLAVDASNQPALAMYAECGFGLWGQRSVMVKKLESLSNSRDPA